MTRKSKIIGGIIFLLIGIFLMWWFHINNVLEPAPTFAVVITGFGIIFPIFSIFWESSDKKN